jgi:uncharacterized protein YecE (DUF72 family)
MSKVWIGTSGWTYDGWRGPFYPPDLAKAKWLCWYASQFRTTEINGSFYRTPSLKAVAAWREQTPKDFLFAWKASKFITHWKRLSENCANSLELMETRLKAWTKFTNSYVRTTSRFAFPIIMTRPRRGR